MGKYLDILARAGLLYDQNDINDKSPPTRERDQGDISDQSQPGGPFGRISRFGRTLSALESHCPDLIPVVRWQQAVEDGRRFLSRWGEQAEALGWTSHDLFGLHKPPEKPHPSYSRLARYDETGLVWLLQGKGVVALTDSTARIRSKAGVVTVYRKHTKPPFGPVGDSLDDLEPPFGGNDV